MGFKVEHSLQLFYNKTETYSIIKVIGNAYFIQAQLEKKLILSLSWYSFLLFDLFMTFQRTFH